MRNSPLLTSLRSGDRHQQDRGYVIAESAFAIPLLIAVAAITMSLVMVALSSLGLHEAVHTAARDIARGVPADAVRTSLQTAHPHTTVTVAPTPQGVTVAVRREISLLGSVFSGLTIPIERRAVVPWEAGVLSW